MKKVVVIGGGTGTSVVLHALQKSQKHNLTAIVVVSDSGGSTGRLVDEFGFLPIGDIRQCLAALATGEYQQEIKNLLLYRFNKGNGLKGHNLGNLILTALEDTYHSPTKAIETAAKIFRINGKVLPITEKPVELVIEYQDGTIKIGEHTLDDTKMAGQKITNLKLSPKAPIYSEAAKAIKQADMVILGPGDLYGSLLPNTLAKGFKTVLKKTPAKFVYIVNLMTHFSQTHKMTAQMHLEEVIRYCHRHPDVVIVNNAKVNSTIQTMYAHQKEYPVIDDIPRLTKARVVKDDFLAKITFKQKPQDEVKRSLLRHDETKLKKTLLKLL